MIFENKCVTSTRGVCCKWALRLLCTIHTGKRLSLLNLIFSWRSWARCILFGCVHLTKVFFLFYSKVLSRFLTDVLRFRIVLGLLLYSFFCQMPFICWKNANIRLLEKRLVFNSLSSLKVEQILSGFIIVFYYYYWWEIWSLR